MLVSLNPTHSLLYTPGATWSQAITQVNGALLLAVLASCSRGIYSLDLFGIGCDQPSFSLPGYNLQLHLALNGKKQALAYRELAEKFLLPAGQFKDVCQYIHSSWRLLEQELH